MSTIDIFDRPIAYHRAFVSLGAGITGAVMLSQAVYWSKRTDAGDGWFYKTMQEWEEETGLTRSEQEGARKKLVDAGVLEEVRKGVPCRLFFKVNIDVIYAILGAEKPKTSKRKSRKPVCGKPANKDAENPQSGVQDSRKQGCDKPANITENTTEITAEITAENLPAASGSVVADVPRVEIPADMPGPKDQNAKTFKAWANYAFAYRKRYSVWPAWNATVAGQLGKLIDRLGADVAPRVAAYYLGVNDSRLINDCHPVGMLLAKAEGYMTQWQTGRQMNATTARQIEQTQANINAAQAASEAILSREGKRNAFL